MSDNTKRVNGGLGKWNGSGNEGGDEQSSDSEEEQMDFESKREQCLRDLLVLERHFNDLREALYQERLQQVDRRLLELERGLALDLKRKTTELESTFQERSHLLELQRDYQLQENEICFGSAEQAAEQDLENGRQILFDSIAAKLEAEMEKLKKDKQAADVNLAIWLAEKRAGGRSRRESRRERRKQTAVQPPFIVYMLKEAEIEEDWQLVRRASLDPDLWDKPSFLSTQLAA